MHLFYMLNLHDLFTPYSVNALKPLSGGGEHHNCSLLKVKAWLHYFHLRLSGSVGRSKAISLFSREKWRFWVLERYLRYW